MNFDNSLGVEAKIVSNFFMQIKFHNFFNFLHILMTIITHEHIYAKQSERILKHVINFNERIHGLPGRIRIHLID